MALAAALCVSLFLIFAFAMLTAASPALAATDDIESVANEYQARIEEATASYNELSAQLEELEGKMDANEARIAEIEAALPQQRQNASVAAISLYKLNHDGFSPFTLLFSVGSLADFLRNVEYMDHVQEKLSDDVLATEALEAELLATQKDLDAEHIEVDARKSAAEDALSAAIAAREAAIAAAKAKAEEDARLIAEENAKAAEEKEEASASDEGEETSEEAGEITAPKPDGMTGSEDRATFMAQWTPRIDSYLSGSPLAGQGATFAGAAWDYGVDPRFSPAISCIESGKGVACFLPHNAWGWGSVSWGSWEEAIRDHVAGLSRGYGYTVSVEGAQRYCPPNWQFWYSRVSEEMNRI